MKPKLHRNSRLMVQLLIMMMVSGCILQRPKPVVANLFHGVSGGCISIGRGRIPFHCGDSTTWIPEKRICSPTALKELGERWQFVPVEKEDSALVHFGNVTPDFMLWGYDSAGKNIWGIYVYYNGEELFGLYHRELGALKPLRKETSCYYMLPFSW